MYPPAMAHYGSLWLTTAHHGSSRYHPPSTIAAACAPYRDICHTRSGVSRGTRPRQTAHPTFQPHIIMRHMSRRAPPTLRTLGVETPRSRADEDLLFTLDHTDLTTPRSTAATHRRQCRERPSTLHTPIWWMRSRGRQPRRSRLFAAWQQVTRSYGQP